MQVSNYFFVERWGDGWGSMPLDPTRSMYFTQYGQPPLMKTIFCHLCYIRIGVSYVGGLNVLLQD